MAVLITGGTGYVGSYLARRLVAEGEQRPVLFDLSPNLDNVRDIAADVDIVQGDFSDPLELMTVLRRKDYSAIFHLAYMIFQDEQHPSIAVKTNILGTTNLFEMARVSGVQRVIWASSGAINGFVTTTDKPTLVTEDDRPLANSLYGASKLFNEHYAENLARKHGFDHIALRLNSTYGKGRAERRGFSSWGVYPGKADVYTYVVEQAARGEETILPPASHHLVWAYVKDCANAFYCAYKADKPKNRIFNFSGEIRPVKDTFDCLKSLFPSLPLAFGDEAMTIVPYLDDTRLQTELGFKREYSMEKGIEDYVGMLLRK